MKPPVLLGFRKGLRLNCSHSIINLAVPAHTVARGADQEVLKSKGCQFGFHNGSWAHDSATTGISRIGSFLRLEMESTYIVINANPVYACICIYIYTYMHTHIDVFAHLFF